MHGIWLDKKEVLSELRQNKLQQRLPESEDTHSLQTARFSFRYVSSYLFYGIRAICAKYSHTNSYTLAVKMAWAVDRKM